MKNVNAEYNESSEDDVIEIKVKVTNTTDEDIQDVYILSPQQTNDGIEIKSLVQGVPYEELLGSLVDQKLNVLISTHFVSGAEHVVNTPFKLHTTNVNGKYNGTYIAPSNPDNSATWISPKPVKWGGKKKYTHIVHECIPANTSLIIILTPQKEKETILPPKECTKVFYNLEEKISHKKVMMKEDEVLYALKTHKPDKIYSMEYSNEKPFFVIESYDFDGVTLYCSAWKQKEPIWMDWSEFYKKIKSEGLKNLIY